MRRLAVALIVALLALTLTGCGGGGGEEEGAQPQAQQPVAPAPRAPEGDVAPIPDRSDATSETFVPFVADEATPPSVVERLRTKQAMLILFYDSSQLSADDVEEQVELVVDENTGLIDLITYDLGKYAAVDANGAVKVDDARLAKDPNGKQAVQFARSIGVDHVPYIVIIDDQGYKIFWSRGFIDAELLERQVERAGS